MTQYPIVINVSLTERGERVEVSTSIERALRDAKTLEAELRCIELDYTASLGAAKAALASAGTGRYRDPRAFWFAGKYLAEFIARLEAHGFYLVGKNTTPAEHIGMSRASVEKMMAFYQRYPDPFQIDTSIPWSKYRDNREPRDE